MTSRSTGLNEIDGSIEVDDDHGEDELDVALDVTNLAGKTIVLDGFPRVEREPTEPSALRSISPELN